MVSSLAFTTPLLMLGLGFLPILWWLLRAVPPAAVRRRFPGIALLLGLRDREQQTDKTPWWLLCLRMLAIAALIVGFSGPVLNPERDKSGSGPLLVAMDASWASAPDWTMRLGRVEKVLADAARAGRPVAVVLLSEPPSGELVFQSADAVMSTLRGLEPRPWGASEDRIKEWLSGLGDQNFETVWLSDGLERPARSALLSAFQARGRLHIIEQEAPVYALSPAVFKDGQIVLRVQRSHTGDLQNATGSGGRLAEVTVSARGAAPNGVQQELARASGSFEPGTRDAEVLLDLPNELRNRVRRFEIAGLRSAGGVALSDDALRRRKVGLVAARSDQEVQDLLSPLHYLNRALAPTADLVEGDLQEILISNPDVIILADVARLAEPDHEALLDWVENGGLLVRFAGPRIAATDMTADMAAGLAERDPLLPVRLRAGGRSVGGAMSWGTPKKLRQFSRDSPFFGLKIPEDVEVSSQVVAQPDPDLSERTIASLADGTPLVTRARVSEGQVILFHVTANAQWSSLPLSGLFVQMLERLAISTRVSEIAADDLQGTTWVAQELMDGFGAVRDAGTMAGIDGALLVGTPVSAELPPGLYAGDDRRIAVNVISQDTVLERASWPAGLSVEGLRVVQETPLMGALLVLGVGVLLVDIIATLMVSGKLRASTMTAALALICGMAVLWATSDRLYAQIVTPQASEGASEGGGDEQRALDATADVVLAYVKTGDPSVDRVSRQGLAGLSLSLTRRSSVEPASPIEVDLEVDELSFFPLLYWPVVDTQPTPSSAAYAKLNRYLRTGGMILFDTRDGDIGGFGSATPNGRKLQLLAAPLDIPALEVIPDDHVLTRTFYLLQDFPGRHDNPDIWVEAAAAQAEQVEGVPFRNLNDGVTPVLIGGNDWAAAWARDANGNPMYRVGRGYGGERQREMAIRFGVNLVMHVLTGNYKSDQVHIPALLDRLGN